MSEHDSPRGRRRPRKGDLKERAILDTAERLLASKPLENISIDELAVGAGISRPTFYFYFESKQAVLQALADRLSADLVARARQWPDVSPYSPRELTRQGIEAVANFWREHGPVARAVLEGWPHPQTRALWDSTVAVIVDAAATRIDIDRQQGRVPPGPPAHALVTALSRMTERCMYTAYVADTASPNDQDLVDTLTTIWLRAIYMSDDPPRAPR